MYCVCGTDGVWVVCVGGCGILVCSVCGVLVECVMCVGVFVYIWMCVRVCGVSLCVNVCRYM